MFCVSLVEGERRKSSRWRNVLNSRLVWICGIAYFVTKLCNKLVWFKIKKKTVANSASLGFT